jgi:hypothetical protein
MEQNEIKKLEEKYIFQKEFESSITSNDLKIYKLAEEDYHIVELERDVEKLEDEENKIDYLLGKAK